jgi:nucleotide-binding universal stress UspA family protein
MSGIVVGIDGSDGSKLALAWAAEEARLRHVSLTLVEAWQLPVGAYDGTGWSGIGTELLEDLRQAAELRLDEICAEFSADLDGLTVERKVVESAAATALVEAAGGADLLVVGTRGRGGFAGLLLGSVSQQCAHHSPCPVVIIPPVQDQ